MHRKALKELLDAVRDGSRTVDDALEALRDFPVAQLEDASLDTHRTMRRGFPEVVLGEGKSVDQLRRIVGRLLPLGDNVLVTRIAPDAAAAVLETHPGGEHDPVGRLLVYRQVPVPLRGRGPICVVTAGTSDAGVAAEAVMTAELMGNEVERIVDVGVAGIHRLLAHHSALRRARVVIVAAGMEGALASVVGGLVDCPVVAVPTSVGYGASFHGLAALLGMLNSCAAGVTVVNIDNGFGAAYAAALMNRATE